jgi:hypothetical protein
MKWRFGCVAGGNNCVLACIHPAGARYGGMPTLMGPMFKPASEHFRAAFRDHAMDFRDFSKRASVWF